MTSFCAAQFHRYPQVVINLRHLIPWSLFFAAIYFPRTMKMIFLVVSTCQKNSFIASHGKNVSDLYANF